MTDRPSGTVTFLFTDIEDSTVLWERDRRVMGGAVARHDEIVGEVLAGYGGYVFTTAGDSFAVAFARSVDAASAAEETQRRLDAERWPESAPIRVRMGLHTGEAQERDGDFFGPAVNRAARVMGAGHGGQVLVSNVTSGLLDEHDLRDLGTHRLKGLSSPERLWQLGSDQFPALRLEAEAPGNLPVSATSFLGREAELDRVADLVEHRRVVTLVGAGGIGKSRLAVEAVVGLGWLFEGGLWWCDLQAVADEAGLGYAVLDGIGGQTQPGMGPLDSALAYMADRRMLLVVDNCEHLLGGCADVIERIEAGCPQVHVLCTSREPIGVVGEQVVPLGGLDAAVELFLERARDVDAGFELTDGETEVVAELCSHLDEMPLAIELAAARSRTMRPAELLERLDDRLRLLRGKRRSERHQTLRATVQWSFDLLSDIEQQVFVRLSVFAGSFDLAGAVAVCSDGEIDDLDVEDAVMSLVDRSMVTTVTGVSSTRFRLLETLRAWGEDWLFTNNDPEPFRALHSEYYCELMTRCGAMFWTPQERDAWDALTIEWDNIRAAVDVALDHGDSSRLDGLGDLGLWGVFALRPRIGEWARTAVIAGLFTSPDGESALRGAWGAWSYWLQGDFDDLDRATGTEVTDDYFSGRGLRAFAAYIGAQARGDRGRADHITSSWLTHVGDSDGVESAVLAHASRVHGHPLWPDAADEVDISYHADLSIELASAVGAPSVLALTTGLSAISRVADEPERASTELSEILELLRPFPGHFLEVMPNQYLVVAAILLEDNTLALERLETALRFCIDGRAKLVPHMSLYMAALLAVRGQSHDEAAILLGAAEETGYTGQPLLGIADMARTEVHKTLGERAEPLMAQGAQLDLMTAAHRALAAVQTLQSPDN